MNNDHASLCTEEGFGHSHSYIIVWKLECIYCFKTIKVIHLSWHLKNKHAGSGQFSFLQRNFKITKQNGTFAKIQRHENQQAVFYALELFVST